jgi:enoyl-CoA hydratase/carnithine racemase
MGAGDVTVDREGSHVGVVGMHRPPNNYFDTAVVAGLASAYEELAASDWCRTVVLAAEGKHFCAGVDFGGNSGQDVGALYDAALRLFAAPLPVVAAVQGAAVGGGLGLALAADFRVAVPEARFAANFALLGIHHGFALTVTLPAAVGQQAALDLLYTGRRIGGDEALRIGLADRLAEPGRARAEAHALAAQIAAAAPLAVRSIRATMRAELTGQALAAMSRERAEQERLMQTADWKEGVAAVSQRRPARFSGS